MNTTPTQTPDATYHRDIGTGAINLLKSPLATLIVLCSALLAQLPHAADVFRLIVVGDGLWPTLHSYTYAIALELAVLLFVVQRRNVESYLFAFVSILVNLSYYYLHGVQLFSVAALPAWLVSIALPAAIAQYSHLIAAATDGHTATPADAPAVRRYRWQFWRKPAEVATMDNSARAAVQTPVARPSATTGHPDATPAAAPEPAATPKQAEPDAMPQPDKRTQAMQLRDEGYTPAEIAKMTDAKYSTVQSWLRRATAQTNGVHQ